MKSKDKKIKIIYITGPLVFGGAERFNIDLVNNLDKNIFDPQIISIHNKDFVGEEFDKQGLKIKKFIKKYKIDLGLIFKLRKYLKSEKPDIIHTQLFAGDAWGRIAAILAGVPAIVLTEQNVTSNDIWLRRKVKYILSFFTHKTFAISQGVKESMIKEGISTKKLQVIYNGIEIDKFKNTEFKLNTDAPIFFNIGRLEKQKGQIYLIQAFKILLKKYPQAELWIAGSGSLEKELKTESKELSNVKFLGTRKDIADIFKQIDIFVLPSLWEGMGVVLPEAMLARKPIIASNVPAVKEVVKDNKTGLLSEPKDVNKLAKKMEKYLVDKNFAKKMADSAFNFAKEKFDIKNITKQYETEYLETYEHIINK
jgi:L-malate glycosyltransferase